MTYEITLFFRQFWIDPRLAWGKLDNGTQFKRADDTYNVAADMVDLLWVPDSFFIDEIGTGLRIPTVKLKIPEKHGKSRIPNFCYIQVIVFDLSYLPVARLGLSKMRKILKAFSAFFMVAYLVSPNRATSR